MFKSRWMLGLVDRLSFYCFILSCLFVIDVAHGVRLEPEDEIQLIPYRRDELKGLFQAYLRKYGLMNKLKDKSVSDETVLRVLYEGDSDPVKTKQLVLGSMLNKYPDQTLPEDKSLLGDFRDIKKVRMLVSSFNKQDQAGTSEVKTATQAEKSLKPPTTPKSQDLSGSKKGQAKADSGSNPLKQTKRRRLPIFEVGKNYPDGTNGHLNTLGNNRPSSPLSPRPRSAGKSF